MMFARGVAWVAIAALAGAAALLSGCDLDVGALQHRTVSYAVGVPLNVLVVHAHLGGVAVTGGAQGRVSVTERLSYRGTAPTTTHSASGGTLTLDSKCPAHETCGVSYRVQVPRALTVNVSTDAGAIRLSGLGGQVTAHTNAGGINLSSLSGPLEVSNHAGSITGQRITSARATLSSTAGSITVTYATAPASLIARTTAGSITVRVPGDVPYAVDARSSVGSAQVSVPQASAAPHAITARTEAGSVSVAPA